MGLTVTILGSSGTYAAAESACSGFLVRSPYRTDRVLAALECPVLILHGSDDTLIPVSHARANAKLAKHATLVEMAGNHNDFPRDEAAYWKAIDELLAKAR